MSRQNFWMAKALRVAIRRNIACWLEKFLPAAMIICGLGAAALLLLRTLKMPATPLWFYLAAAGLIGAGICWLLARRKFFNSTDALVRLDDVGHLHNRLTAAHAGVGEWPAIQNLRDPARWNWVRLAGPIALCAFVLVSAAWLPVPVRKTAGRITEQPLSWTQVESWLQTLEESKLVEPEALEKLRSELNEIRQQSSENWYSQSSLEAGDSLRQQTEQSLQTMASDLQKTQDALTNSQNANGRLSPAETKALDQELQKAVHGLEMGTLPLNKEMLNSLKNLDASKLKQMTPEQLAQLQKKLKEGKQVCELCVGPHDLHKEVPTQRGMAGGKGGGGGPAPLTLKDDRTNLRSKSVDTLSNEDLSRATLGDVTGVSKGEHQVKKRTDNNPLTGGSIQSGGDGGDAVWRDSLTPEEREMLQRFFK